MWIILGTMFLNFAISNFSVICKYAGQVKSVAFDNISLDESAIHMVKYYKLMRDRNGGNGGKDFKQGGINLLLLLLLDCRT